MKKKKFITSIILGLIPSIYDTNKSVADIISDTIDSQCYSNPALKIDQNTGTRHLVYSRGNELVYANSLDNFANKTIINNQYTNYSNPAIDIDSLGRVHVGFNAYVGSPFWKTFYTNSLNWNNVKNLGVGNNQEDISLAVDKNNKVYITTQNDYLGYDMDIILLSSTDYQNFTTQRIQKTAHQLNPTIDIDSKNNVHLAYWDWSDGVVGGAGQYKTRYRNSLDDFSLEETISTANQSYSANLKVDGTDNVWIGFKDSTFSGDSFDIGDVFLADKNSGWSKERITTSPIYFMQDRATSLAIDDLGNRHISWSEVDWNQGLVNIMYGNSSLVTQVADVGYEPSLGWVSLDTFNNQPYLVANVNSLVGYQIPSPPTIFLLGLGLLGLKSRR